VLGHYVRKAGVLSLGEAVRKMTGLPASIIGMVDRGFIAVGMAADLAVFDPVAVIDRATFERPMESSERRGRRLGDPRPRRTPAGAVAAHVVVR